MLDEILQIIQKSPENESSYREALLKIVRYKHVSKKCLQILVKNKEEKGRLIKTFTDIDYYIFAIKKERNFDHPVNFCGLIEDALNELNGFDVSSAHHRITINEFLRDNHPLINKQISGYSGLNPYIEKTLLAILALTKCLLEPVYNNNKQKIIDKISGFFSDLKQLDNSGNYTDIQRILNTAQSLAGEVDGLMGCVNSKEVFDILVKIPDNAKKEVPIGILYYNYIYDDRKKSHKEYLATELKEYLELKGNQFNVRSTKNAFYLKNDFKKRAKPRLGSSKDDVNKVTILPRPVQHTSNANSSEINQPPQQKKIEKTISLSWSDIVKSSTDAEVPHQKSQKSAQLHTDLVKRANLDPSKIDSKTRKQPLKNSNKSSAQTNPFKHHTSAATKKAQRSKHGGKAEITTKPHNEVVPKIVVCVEQHVADSSEKLFEIDTESRVAVSSTIKQNATDDQDHDVTRSFSMDDDSGLFSDSSDKIREKNISKSKKKRLNRQRNKKQQEQQKQKEKDMFDNFKKIKNEEEKRLLQDVKNQAKNSIDCIGQQWGACENFSDKLGETVSDMKKSDIRDFLQQLTDLEAKTIECQKKVEDVVSKQRATDILCEIKKHREHVYSVVVPDRLKACVNKMNDTTSEEKLTVIPRLNEMFELFTLFNLNDRYVNSFERLNYETQGKFFKSLDELLDSYPYDGAKQTDEKYSFRWIEDKVTYLDCVWKMKELFVHKEAIFLDKINHIEEITRLIFSFHADVLLYMQIRKLAIFDLMKRIKPNEEHCKNILDFSTEIYCDRISLFIFGYLYPITQGAFIQFNNKPSADPRMLLMQHGLDPFLADKNWQRCNFFASILFSKNLKNIVFCINQIDKRCEELKSNGQLKNIFKQLSDYLQNNNNVPEVYEALKKLFRACKDLQNFSFIQEDKVFKSFLEKSHTEKTVPNGTHTLFAANQFASDKSDKPSQPSDKSMKKSLSLAH